MVVSKFTILVLAAFNSRLRKLILAVSADIGVSLGFALLLVEVPETLGAVKGGACTLSEVRIGLVADRLGGEGRDTSEAVACAVVEGGGDTTAKGDELTRGDTVITLLDVLVLLRFVGLLHWDRCEMFLGIGEVSVVKEEPVGCELGGGATYVGDTLGFAQFDVWTGRQLVL